MFPLSQLFLLSTLLGASLLMNLGLVFCSSRIAASDRHAYLTPSPPNHHYGASNAQNHAAVLRGSARGGDASNNVVGNHSAPLSPDLLDGKERQCRCVNCNDDELCGGLWKANRFFPPIDDERVRAKRVHVIVSHCKHDLYWISDFTGGFDIASMHVVSKCGESPKGAPEMATIEVLPNVGRCDHSYAYYLANVLGRRNILPGEENDSIVVFLKDDMSKDNLHQHGEWASLASMIRIASSANGFACGVDATTAGIDKKWERISFSPYHDKETLSQFNLTRYNRTFERGYDADGVEFKSSYRNLRAFYEDITEGGAMPAELAQVCYGGVFAASYDNIKQVDASVWRRAQEALERGDSIEEGHFMERCWGLLLATPLQKFQIEALRNYASDAWAKRPSMMGVLRRVEERPHDWKKRKQTKMGEGDARIRAW